MVVYLTHLLGMQFNNIPSRVSRSLCLALIIFCSISGCMLQNWKPLPLTITDLSDGTFTIVAPMLEVPLQTAANVSIRNETTYSVFIHEQAIKQLLEILCITSPIKITIFMSSIYFCAGGDKGTISLNPNLPVSHAQIERLSRLCADRSSAVEKAVGFTQPWREGGNDRDLNKKVFYQEIFMSIGRIQEKFGQYRDKWGTIFWITLAHEFWHAGQNSQGKISLGDMAEKQAEGFGYAVFSKGANETYDQYLHYIQVNPYGLVPVSKEVFDTLPDCGTPKACIGLFDWMSSPAIDRPNKAE